MKKTVFVVIGLVLLLSVQTLFGSQANQLVEEKSQEIELQHHINSQKIKEVFTSSYKK